MSQPRFGIIPADLLQGLDAGEIAVLAVLAIHADRGGRCFLRQETIASLVGRSRPWVNAALSRLKDKNCIEQTRRRFSHGGLRSSTYRIIHSLFDQDNRCQPHDTSCQADDRECQPDDSNKHKIDLEYKTPSPETSVAFSKTADVEWEPGSADIAWARGVIEGVSDEDIMRHIHMFQQKCRAHGYVYRDMSAAWRSWFLSDAPRMQSLAKKDHTDKPTRGSNTNQRIERLREMVPHGECAIGFIERFAKLRNIPLPEPDALKLDIELLAHWSEESIKKAEHLAIQKFAYRRIPTSLDLNKLLEEDDKSRKRNETKTLSPILQRKIGEAEVLLEKGMRPSVDKLVASYLQAKGACNYEVVG